MSLQASTLSKQREDKKLGAEMIKWSAELRARNSKNLNQNLPKIARGQSLNENNEYELARQPAGEMIRLS